ncbi:hypothetical protein [Microbacterium rhizosphaerae]|uniref:Uncharacterized protein n=1 Tax=Microbacterium rhizosphaerae TaxID=1678237 RepID=A0ABZ0SP80_9MICO|nr:hypothetical protein [Microbacterium rhizosphaerae]WPR89062.1 hypothetical protein SM116_15045 [Microbacterium rhizosphaerae]
MTVQEIHSPAVFSRHVNAGTPERTRTPLLSWRWSPRGLEHRGRRVGREEERAYRDLQAAAAVADWR